MSFLNLLNTALICLAFSLPLFSKDVEHTLETREYFVHLPPQYSASKKWPVVFVFHGGGGTAKGMKVVSEMDSTADEKGFIAVYPQGIGKKAMGKVFGTWNAGLCCGEAMEKKIDDVGFVSAMITDLQKKYSIDSHRIFSTGLSNGGAISYRLACELSDKIAAVAPIAAQGTFEPCKPKRAIPILHIHGLEDPCSPYKGGQCGGCFQHFLSKLFNKTIPPIYWPCLSVEDYMKTWKEREHCKGKGKITYEKGDVSCFTFDECDQKSEVTYCSLKNTGHSWPGGNQNEACLKKPDGFVCKTYVESVGKLNKTVNANALLWDFFEKHPLP